MKQFTVKVRENLLKRRADLFELMDKRQKERTSNGITLEQDLNEQAASEQNDSIIDALNEIEKKELAEIDNALRRLELGKYGICEVDGEFIDEKRLIALPFARTCTQHSES
ncbi:MAG: TraR/DksA family transcriptional regulator [Bdellovibrio sp.]|nr:TraR/DksA family transcriptional regulator [Bdellovibrio sp.]